MARTMDVAFIGFLRDEAKFASAEELIRQMQEDARLAREVLGRAPDAFPPI